MEYKDLSPELREELEQNAASLLKDEGALEELHQRTGISVQAIVKMLTDLSQPTSSDVNNNETGFWKGAALVALAGLAGVFVLALKAMDKNNS